MNTAVANTTTIATCTSSRDGRLQPHQSKNMNYFVIKINKKTIQMYNSLINIFLLYNIFFTKLSVSKGLRT